MEQLTKDELYCVAKTLQGCMFGDGNAFYGCQHCKIQKTKCASGNKPHPDMYIDRVRNKLTEITGVDLRLCDNGHRFEDITNNRGEVRK